MVHLHYPEYDGRGPGGWFALCYNLTEPRIRGATMSSCRFILLLSLLSPTTSVSNAPAQLGGGTVALYSDSLFTDSTYVDNVPSVLHVYVVHQDFFALASAIQFRIERSAGFTGTWLSESSPFFPLVGGDSQTGVAISYGGCKTPPLLLLDIMYFAHGTSGPCSYLASTAHPPSPFGKIEVVTCQETVFAEPGRLRVNCTVPVEETTWGRVKALYLN